MKKLKLFTIISLLITLLFGNVVYAEEKVYTDGYLQYVITNDGIKIIDYFGKEDKVVVPMAIGESFVTSIASGAFKEKNIKSIELPETVKTIENGAFDNINKVEISYLNEEDYFEINRVEEEKNEEIEEANAEEISKNQDDSTGKIENNNEEQKKEDNSQDFELITENDEIFTGSEVDAIETFEQNEREENNERQSNINIDGNNISEVISIESITTNKTKYIVIGLIIIAFMAIIVKNRKNKE